MSASPAEPFRSDFSLQTHVNVQSKLCRAGTSQKFSHGSHAVFDNNTLFHPSFYKEFPKTIECNVVNPLVNLPFESSEHDFHHPFTVTEIYHITLVQLTLGWNTQGLVVAPDLLCGDSSTNLQSAFQCHARKEHSASSQATWG